MGEGSDAQDIGNRFTGFSRMDPSKKYKKGRRKLLVGTWNVQGWANKALEITQQFHRMNLDVLVTSEMKKKGSGCEEVEGTLLFWSGVDKDQRAKAGVGILIRKQLKRFIKSWKPVNERIIKVELEMYGREIIILGVHGPTNDSQVQDKENFSECLRVNVEEMKGRKEIILAGDLNGRTGRRIGDTVVGCFGEESINDSGERLIEPCELQSLRVLNGFYRHKEIHKFTWTQENRGLKSIIDYMIMRQKTTILVKDVRVKRGTECGSVHRMVIAKLEFPWNGNRRENRQDGESNVKESKTPEVKLKKYHLELLQEERIRALYQSRLDQRLEEFSFDSPEDTYETT
ncbi:craniofacial development protein 2-like [Nilaparvata lugens]|uniref:craniofacial development protein 2-like n=1 Tax=Nilaparvata lugens TaxID=108931 RepID=UPI00193CB71B|nr:craniofacial development protein 2-like [Nilaparvata lugens]